MENLNNYFNDGADYQAQRVLMDFKDLLGDGFDSDYDSEKGCYKHEIKIKRWENCREQGYVLCLKNEKKLQMNIAFFEHRNSDRICAVKWIQNIENPTIQNAEFGNIYKNKYDVSKEVPWREYMAMSDWIYKEFEGHLNNI